MGTHSAPAIATVSITATAIFTAGLLALLFVTGA
jgi:hypothetical protein